MYKAAYLVAALCLAAALIYANLQSPPMSPYLVGGALGGTAVILVVAGRALQLLEDIRNEMVEG